MHYVSYICDFPWITTPGCLSINFDGFGTQQGENQISQNSHFYFRFSAIITPWEEAGWQNLTFLLSLDNTAWKRPGTPVCSLSLLLWLSLIIAIIVRIWWERKPKRLLSWNSLFSCSSLKTYICYPSVRDIPCHCKVNGNTYIDLCC